MSSTFDVSSMDELYPELFKLLKDHDVKVKVFEAYKDRPDELEEAEGLISDLEQLGCKGIEKKLNEKKAEEFDSTVSELKVAKVLLNNKHNVEFLSEKDPCFKNGKGKTYKSPDIISKDNDSTTCVEVVRLNVNVDIMELIQKEIEDYVKCLPYRVDVYLSERLSIPKVIESKDQKKKLNLNRKEQKDLVLTSLEIFKQSYDKIKAENVLPSLNISTPDIDFDLTKVNRKQGYIGFFFSDCAGVPTELIEYLKQRCIDEKNKPNGFSIDLRKNPFIIAIDLHMRLIGQEDVNRLLYGDVVVPSHDSIKWMKNEWVTVITEIHNRNSWKKIEQVQSNGWDSFLREKFLIPDNETLSYIDQKNEGIFVSDEMKDVSAILIIDRKNKCFFYPNPFCRDEINNPKIVNFINTNENVQVQNKLPWMK